MSKVTNSVKENELGFLNLSGRKAFYSQGIYGDNAVIAVVDTGVSPHNELRGRLLTGRSFVNYTNRPFDDNGHGTHVAATIAGKNVGIAPGASILPVKALDSKGRGTLDNLIQALNYVGEYSLKTRKINMVNLSLSVDDDLAEEDKERFHTAVKNLVENDIAVIVAAGNTGKEDIRYPAAFQEVIAVGAVDISQKRAMFSTMGNHIDVCQIGVDVVSAWYKGGYATMSGTSMSTPMVCGIGALLTSKYHAAFNEVIKEDYLWKSLKLNTKDLGIQGVDREYGTGFATLQPLQIHMEMENNSPYLKINEQVYRLQENLVFSPDNFMLPGKHLSEASGAYITLAEEKLTLSY